ncbi:Indoleamine 2,3-dioxygenase 2 [Cytospora mali]|uniref:Indoleamine 2,3-dioxygenase 2 n=1 Tax=Cytospora mali TaxID=578113 RepID=A0A194WCD8_CYTMA|nr:Indoleamine 2,3-dioxygenase 2 [Valsa mali]
MGSVGIEDDYTSVSDLKILEDCRPDDMSMPAFMVSKPRGFLPRADPVWQLPPEFEPLESLLQRMPVKTASGEPGLLAHSKLGPVVDSEFPDLTWAVDKHKDNLPLMNALYRDYSFLLSAYLLEPCHERFMRGESYGLGRQSLPAVVARPMARVAELTGFMPFMEYAGSYALYNYKLVDPAKGMDYDNIRLIRAFEHGLDHKSSEAGFVLVHIDMVKNSGPLVSGTVEALDAAHGSREALNTAMKKQLEALKKINATMETMWMKSKPRDYTSFRTFIFGITSQSMFPNGVVYEGINDGKPMSFRGESGANDSMIPLMDNFLQIPMPDTPLTEILKDFRKYRPSNHRAFLQHVRDKAIEVDLRGFALQLQGMPGEAEEAVWESRRLWLQLLDQVREFRWRHWCFGKEYILKTTSHPTATGGSPIVTWLPNQLSAVLKDMVNIAGKVGEEKLGKEVQDIMDLVRRQEETLRKEVEKYCEERGVNSS